MALNKKSSLILDSASRPASAGLMALNKKSSLIFDSASRPASAGLMALQERKALSFFLVQSSCGVVVVVVVWWWCGGVVWWWWWWRGGVVWWWWWWSSCSYLFDSASRPASAGLMALNKKLREWNKVKSIASAKTLG
ncbi:MAG: hypothetical protein ABSD50_15560 [Smithella sp.]